MNSAVRPPPICREPVGEGAKRVTTSEGSGIDIQFKAAAPLNTRPRTYPSGREILAWILLQAKAQADRWSLWTPVAYGCGCGVYFAMKAEPALVLMVIAAMLSVIAAWALRRWGRAPASAAVALLLAFAACGMLSGKLQTLAMRGPVCPPLAGVTVEGWVVDMAGRGATGPRLLIAPTFIRGVPNDRLPKRLRITVKEDAVVGPGSGGVDLATGTWSLWVKITDNPEIPVINAGLLVIV